MAERRRRIAVVFLLAVGVGSGGCNRKDSGEPPPAILKVCDPFDSLMQAEVDEYASLYPGTRISVGKAETREAIVNLLNDSADIILTDRPLNEEEQDVAARSGIPLTENAFANDALVVLVNGQNPLRKISMTSLRSIVSREWVTWRKVPESRWDHAIDLVLTGVNSGPPELLQTKFFSLSAQPVPTTRVSTQREALAYVRDHSDAIAFVSMAAIAGASGGFRIVAVQSPDSGSAGSYVLPTQANVYESLYPLHYSLYLTVTGARSQVGAGFSTHAIKATTGQKAVQNAGLVPVNIPMRVIQLTAE